jgi:hypothetical protein
LRAEKHVVLPDEDADEFAERKAALVDEAGYGRRAEFAALAAEGR